MLQSSSVSDVRVFRLPPGTGKTSTVKRVVLAVVAKDKRVAIYAPTVALSREIAQSFGSSARVMLGRDQPNMCQRADTARAVGEAGQSPSKTLCPDCPFKSECRYLAQFVGLPSILIFCHAHITLPRPDGWTPDFIVIDESFWTTCIEFREIPIESFMRSFPLGFDPAFRAALFAGLMDDKLLARVGALPDAAKLLENAARLAFRGTRRPKFGPTATADDVRRTAGKQGNAVIFARVMREIAAEMTSAPARSSSHVARQVGDKLHISILKELNALVGVESVLVIDAQANEGILQRVMRGRTIKIVRKDATRNAEIVQVTSSVFGVGRLENNPELVQQVARFARSCGDQVLLVMPKSARHKLTGEPKDKGTLPVSARFGGVDVAHFGNVKGSNFAEKHNTAVLLGRPQLPPDALLMWSGLFTHDAKPLLFAENYMREDRGYCHSSGRGASVWVHHDPRFQSLLEQFREWEVVQAMDRLRLFSSTRKTVYIFTDLPLPIQVSRFVTEREIIPEWRNLALQSDGLLLDSPKWLAMTFPARFSAASVAKDWLKAGWPAVGDLPILPPLMLRHRPKPTRAGRGSGFKRALYLGNPEGIQAALDLATGKPTEFVIDGPTAEPGGN